MACCGDTPTLEILAAVSILRQHLRNLKIRVVNVVDLMKLQSKSEHPHGLSDTDYCPASVGNGESVRPLR
jgi:xylulose-5-phosphate/fructose-6-phosphate phosphoketolase